MIELHPLTGIGEVKPGEDLAALLGAAISRERLAPIRDYDVLVVTQKIVSKAEDRWADLDRVAPGDEAERLAKVTAKDPRFVQLVLDESTAIIRARPQVLITRHRRGHIMANAGIDQSNLGPERAGWVLLLPLDPDASAERLRETLGAALGAAPAVIISDSFGRPWRKGVTGVALGGAGLPSLLDQRGQLDRDGRPLEITQVGLADMIATAAGLAMGEGGEGVPAVLVRGLSWPDPPSPAAALVRPLEEDLFQ